MESKVS